MKRYTLRAAIHDAKIFNQLRLEYRRTNKNWGKDPSSGWLSEWKACFKKTISPETNPINGLPAGSGNFDCHCGPAYGFRIALVILTVITTLTLIATLSGYGSRRFLVSTSSGLAPLPAVSAEEKAPIIKIQLPESFPDYGEPVVPQIEEVPPQEALLPEPLDHYSVAQEKTGKPAPRRHMHVVRPRPNFFEKLVAGFIKLQKHQAANGLVQPHGATE